MSDQPPLSARPRPPQSPPNGQKRRRPRALPPPASPESRFIGYLVLGFGVLAVVAVLILAFSGGGDKEERQADARVADSLAQDIVPAPAQPAPAPKPVVQQPIERKELYFKRQPNLDAAAMEGSWQAAIGKYTVVLQMQKGSYQIVYAQPDPNSRRLYSLGTYKIVAEDMVELTPRLDWPAPTSRMGAGYEILTRAEFPILVTFQSGRMLWQNPPQSEKRVLAPYRSPVTAAEDANYVVWQRLK